jgi:hypothetical protein
LSGAVAEVAEQVAGVVLAEHDPFAKKVGEAWVALNEESVDDAAVVGDDVADVNAERGVRGMGVLRESARRRRRKTYGSLALV